MSLLLLQSVLFQAFKPSSSCKHTYVFPAEATSSSGTIRVQVSISQVALLVQPQATLVIIQNLLPLRTTDIFFFKFQTNFYISRFFPVVPSLLLLMLLIEKTSSLTCGSCWLGCAARRRTEALPEAPLPRTRSLCPRPRRHCLRRCPTARPPSPRSPSFAYEGNKPFKHSVDWLWKCFYTGKPSSIRGALPC